MNKAFKRYGKVRFNKTRLMRGNMKCPQSTIGREPETCRREIYAQSDNYNLAA
jgi:hypothetical protein